MFEKRTRVKNVLQFYWQKINPIITRLWRDDFYSGVGFPQITKTPLKMNLSGCHQNVLAFVRQQNMNIGVSLLKIDASWRKTISQIFKRSAELNNR